MHIQIRIESAKHQRLELEITSMAVTDPEPSSSANLNACFNPNSILDNAPGSLPSSSKLPLDVLIVDNTELGTLVILNWIATVTNPMIFFDRGSNNSTSLVNNGETPGIAAMPEVLFVAINGYHITDKMWRCPIIFVLFNPTFLHTHSECILKKLY